MSLSLATSGPAAACLGCLARRGAAAAAFFPSRAASVSVSVPSSPVPSGHRAKSTAARPSGVVVRLLEDVPRFGRKDTILRAERGRMRNVWFPRRLAEYMTPARFAQLGLSPKAAIGERDASFQGTPESSSSDLDGPSAADVADVARAAAAAHAALHALDLDPARAAAALAAHVPPALVFRRRATGGTTTTTLFGSVSADDVAAAVREALAASGDADAQRVRVEARDVRFVVDNNDGLPSSQDDAVTADRVKALGRFEMEIALRGGVAPVRRVVEVVAEE